MSNIRSLALPSELMYTAEIALNFRAGMLREQGDKSDYEPKLRKILSAMRHHQSDMERIESWTDDQRMNTAKTMLQYGGHFAQSIANAYFNGDSHNQGRVVAAFSDLFIKYGPGGPFYEEK